MDIFAIGDVHGQYDLLEALLKDWNQETEKLIFLGDLIDRGPDSRKVVSLVQSLVQDKKAIAIKGNHECMYLDWLAHPESLVTYYLPSGGAQMLDSYIGKKNVSYLEGSAMANQMKTEYRDVEQFFRSMSLYEEVGDLVFVHAGVDLGRDDWEDSNPNDFQWIREPFFYLPNETGKTFIFGHTPTQTLNEDKSPKIWLSKDKTRIAIDGGATYGGVLHGLHITDDAFRNVFVDKNLTFREGKNWKREKGE
jgi:serine/threonine protein phosphatase 1